MHSLFAQSELKDLIEKVEKSERLDYAAGIRMMDSQDILALGYMANLVRERKNGNRTLFLVNGHPDSANAQEAKMFYGQIASSKEKIDLMLQLRTVQDSTEGYTAFSPLPFDYQDADSERMDVAATTGFEDLKMHAVARILLDNFMHIKASWRVLGPKLAQVSLAFGVDVLESSEGLSRKAMINLIKKAGRDAVEGDAHYRVLTSN